MSAATVDLTDRASHRERSPFRRALGVGLVFGVVAVYVAIVGILPLMDARWIIVDVVSLGDAALIAIGLSAGAAVAARTTSSEFWRLAPPSLLAGGVAGALLALLTLAMQILPLRQIFIALSPGPAEDADLRPRRAARRRGPDCRQGRCWPCWAPR